MQNLHTKYLIIGGGLSGLTTAFKLIEAGQKEVLILESRDRPGGRIWTHNGIDLGATWFQSHHQYVGQLLEELGVSRMKQYSRGKSVLVYNTMAPAHEFEVDPHAPSANRIIGGSSALINKLVGAVSGRLRLSTEVLSIEENGDKLKVRTSKGDFSADHVVLTIPPLIATRITFSPELPVELTNTMKGTHTWMSNAMKVGLTYKHPFWREKGYSGTLIGQVGAVTELYDHSDESTNSFALMGFVNEALRDMDHKSRKDKIIEYLSRHLGKETLDYLSYEEKDWSQDKDTSCENIKSIYLSPSYGNPIFGDSYMGKKLFISGTETSPISGGYMDGAIYSGIQAAERVLPS